MRYSETLIPTVKEVPADAEIPSHQLMIRAGFMRKLASGTYTYLPLGLKMLRKVSDIIRDEMAAAGAQEIMMPMVQPMELWDRTGRREDYGETLGWFKDRHGRENVLSPTAEEVVTDLVAGLINSYKQLPLNVYQINTKFRDEFRPRFGVLRSREFIMKDAYSFHTSVESLDETYRKMYDAYCRIFKRCGIPFVVVEAESGPIGGGASHEFMVPTEVGEDLLFYTEDGSYAANVEKAEVDPPAKAEPAGDVDAAAEVATPDVGSIEAVCEFLGIQPQEMIKTLIFEAGDGDDKKVIVALIRGDHEINEAKLNRAAAVEAAEMAAEATVENVTGAAVGFAGPIGLAAKVDCMLIDHAVAAMVAGVTGANKTDAHVRNVVPGRDFALDGDNITVADIRNAAPGDTHDGRPLLTRRGIEVGHVFKLGDKYSRKLDATYLNESGSSRPCIMGCYGIGVNRIVASAVEAGHDAGGCVFPISIAPFEMEVLAINAKSDDVMAAAEKLYDGLSARGVDVLFDDRKARPGVKFKDADLLGIPLRIAIGDKALAEGKVELKRRTDAEPTLVALDVAMDEAMKIIDEMRAACEA